MKWEIPPQIKIYEALGTLGDGRMEVDGNTAKVYSSSGNKFYMVTYDKDTHSIMANDNGSYWTGKLGYPSIAYLLSIGVYTYESNTTELLKDIAWKDINQKYKNDFDKTIEEVHRLVQEKGGDIDALKQEVESIHREIMEHIPSKLGTRRKPPSGY